RFSTRIECRSGFFSDRRADARGLVSVWGAGAQSQPIVRLSAHVSYSYSYFTLEDHVFEIACSFCIYSRNTFSVEGNASSFQGISLKQKKRPALLSMFTVTSSVLLI